MEKEYNLRGKQLLKTHTDEGTKPIDKDVIATLSNEDIEALILAIRSVKDDVSFRTLHNLLEEDLRREPEAADDVPPCFYYWDGIVIELCDYDGNYSIIEKEKCKDCPHYGVLAWPERDSKNLLY